MLKLQFKLWLIFYWLVATAAMPASNLYQQYCANCHGKNRLGLMGPALLPENLGRLSPEQAKQVIRNGRNASQMPAFPQLSTAQIKQLIDDIYTPLTPPPKWEKEQMLATQWLYPNPDTLASQPIFKTQDYLNLFVVVELADHYISLLDGNNFKVITRIKTRPVLHGGPKYSSDGRYVYLSSRNGWISKIDLYNLKTVAEIRAGINTRNIALSADDHYILVGNYFPHNLVILDANDLSPIKIIPVRNDFGQSSRVSAVYTAPPRHSFIVALKDLPEIWEIYYQAPKEPIYQGLVHDYQYQEGIAQTEKFAIRKIHLTHYLDDFFFDQNYQHILGSARSSQTQQPSPVQVVNLFVGRTIAEIPIQGLPHLGSGISWDYNNTRVLATPNLKTGLISIIDQSNWKIIKQLPTLGPGFFLRSHPNSPYAWTDVFFGPNKDAIHIIDKQSLAIVKTLKPIPNKTSAHVEFTKDGRYALLSIWEEDGAIIVYDSHTLEEVTRLPMKKPSGKYNIYLKTRYLEGTSH